MKRGYLLALAAGALLLAPAAAPQQQEPATSPPPAPAKILPGMLDPDRAKPPAGPPLLPGTPAPPVKPPAEEGPLIKSTLQVVLVPTMVTDKKGHSINGLRVTDFELYDNDQLQTIERDIAFLPMSLVICIQRSNNVQAVLPKIRKIGTELHDMLVGEGGEAAVVSFDHRIETVQDFTSDGDKINRAVEKLKPGGQNSRMIDAVQEAVHMLKYKKDRRKVILLISETLDRSSEAHVREVATDLELNNIDVYTLNISRIVTSLTTPPDLPRPDPFPPGARPHPPGTSIDPTTMAQLDGQPGDSGDIVPVLVEMYRGVKAIFFRNPARVFTKLTGGREYSFITQSDLENAIGDIGREIRSQYILSYSPNNKLEGGYHRIRVDVAHEGYKIRTRPGYWMAGVPE
jgi:VWFA-related protein